jgi:septum formation topological specificity factor MinE
MGGGLCARSLYSLKEIMRESEIISNFLKKGNQERIKTLLNSTKGRNKFLLTLDHNFIEKVNPKYITQLSGHKDEIINIIKKYFDNKKCFTISSYSKFDKLELNIVDALEMVIGYQMGTIIYSKDGKVMFYESEDQYGRYLIKKAI